MNNAANTNASPAAPAVHGDMAEALAMVRDMLLAPTLDAHMADATERGLSPTDALVEYRRIRADRDLARATFAALIPRVMALANTGTAPASAPTATAPATPPVTQAPPPPAPKPVIAHKGTVIRRTAELRELRDMLVEDGHVTHEPGRTAAGDIAAVAPDVLAQYGITVNTGA